MATAVGVKATPGPTPQPRIPRVGDGDRDSAAGGQGPTGPARRRAGHAAGQIVSRVRLTNVTVRGGRDTGPAPRSPPPPGHLRPTSPPTAPRPARPPSAMRAGSSPHRPQYGVLALDASATELAARSLPAALSADQTKALAALTRIGGRSPASPSSVAPLSTEEQPANERCFFERDFDRASLNHICRSATEQRSTDGALGQVV